MFSPCISRPDKEEELQSVIKEKDGLLEKIASQVRGMTAFCTADVPHTGFHRSLVVPLNSGCLLQSDEFARLLAEAHKEKADLIEDYRGKAEALTRELFPSRYERPGRFWLPSLPPSVYRCFITGFPLCRRENFTGRTA